MEVLAMSRETGKIETETPKFRYALKGQIITSGHKTLTDFSKKMKVDQARISKIIQGWELPGPGLQRKMAETLGITLSELRELF